MKKKLLLLIILIAGSLNPIFSQENTNQHLVPGENQSLFQEDNQTFIYQVKDSVFVSIGFSEYINGEYIFNVCIDNHSDDTLNFDPNDINLFRYTNDTLAEMKAYNPENYSEILDSIDCVITDKERKIRNKNIFSIALLTLYLTAEIAGATGDMDYGTLEAIRLTHNIAQTGIDISRYNTEENLYDLSFTGDYWKNATFKECVVLPHSFKSGNIHFRIPHSDVLEIEISFKYRIFRYSFRNNI